MADRSPPVLGVHGILSFAVISSGTIRQAMEVAEVFIPLRTSLVTIRTTVHDGRFCVMIKETPELGAIRETLPEAVIFAVKGLCDQLSLGQSVDFGVYFDFEAPSYADLAAKITRADVRHGQGWGGLRFDLDHAERSLRPQDAAAFAEAKRICQRELEKIQQNETESTKLRRLFSGTDAPFPDIGACRTPPAIDPAHVASPA